MPKTFRFDVLWMLSERENTARKISWAPHVTALVGGNHTGKSTAVRMLYYAFGCNTRTLGPEWDPKSAVAVSFTVGDAPYLILRRDSVFALFDGSYSLLWVTDDAGELRNRFSELMHFVLPLLHQNGGTKPARPAFFFVPSFVDQDGSWGSSWQTFDSLGEFRDWQRPTIELMLGIRTSEYWKLWSETALLKEKIEAIKKELKVFDQARQRLAVRFPNAPWFRDGLTFRTELGQLESRVKQLASGQHDLEVDRSEAMSQQNMIRAQISLLESALREHAADMRFLDTRRIGDDIICPTCGTAHEHSFHERLNLEAEADQLAQLRTQLIRRADGIARAIAKQESEIAKLAQEAGAVDHLLETHRGGFRLREIIHRAGVGSAHEALEEQARSLGDERRRLEVDIEADEKRLRELDDAERAALIRKRLSELYSHFAMELDVPASLQTRQGSVQTKPRQGGSGGPRAVLAYYFAVGHTAQEFSQEILPPLVLDSPHDKAQDEINRPRVTEFIFRNRIPGRQLIVGLEDSPPATVIFGEHDKQIDLSIKYHILRREEYEEVFSFIQPLWSTASDALAASDAGAPRA